MVNSETSRCAKLRAMNADFIEKNAKQAREVEMMTARLCKYDHLPLPEVTNGIRNQQKRCSFSLHFTTHPPVPCLLSMSSLYGLYAGDQLTHEGPRRGCSEAS